MNKRRERERVLDKCTNTILLLQMKMYKIQNEVRSHITKVSNLCIFLIRPF